MVFEYLTKKNFMILKNLLKIFNYKITGNFTKFIFSSDNIKLVNYTEMYMKYVKILL